MSEPITPATDEEIERLNKALAFYSPDDCPSDGEIADTGVTPRLLLARIQSDAAKLKERDEQIARLTEALKPFASGSWGNIKAWIVNGAPDRDQGLRGAAQLTEFNCAADDALAIRKVTECIHAEALAIKARKA